MKCAACKNEIGEPVDDEILPCEVCLDEAEQIALMDDDCYGCGDEDRVDEELARLITNVLDCIEDGVKVDPVVILKLREALP